MHRARRVSLLAVLALAGALALTGCRSQPSVAIYVGDTTYTQKQMDGLVDQFKKIQGADVASAPGRIAQWIVLRDVAKKIFAEKKWPQPKVDTAAVAEGAGLPADSPLVRLVAEYRAYDEALVGNVKPVAPTTADYTELRKRFIAAGLEQPSTDLAAFRQRLQGDDLNTISTRLGVRKLYEDGIKQAKVTVNPRYSPAEAAILSDQAGHPIIVLPLNSNAGSGSAVHDRA
jgi:hypothetical protein